MKKLLLALFTLVLLCNFCFAQSATPTSGKQTTGKVNTTKMAKKNEKPCSMPCCAGKSSASCTNSSTTSAAQQLENCPLKGTADCPLIKNCPLRGTTNCPYANSKSAETKQTGTSTLATERGTATETREETAPAPK